MTSNYTEKNQLLSAFGLEPGQHVLFVHAHPDDESVATGTAIYQLQTSGVIVHILIATDGTVSTLGDPSIVHSGGRRLEARKAMHELGIPENQQHFLGEQDGALSNSSYKQLVTGIGKLVSDYHCVAIFTPGEDGFDGHKDHIAVHLAALDAAKDAKATPIIWGLDRSGGEVSLSADSELKLKAVRQHASQYPKLAAGLDEEQLGAYSDLLYQGEHYRRIST